MKISHDESFVIISSEEVTFTDFLSVFKEELTSLPQKNTVIQLSENLNTTLDQITLFLDIAMRYKNNGLSFVILCNGIDIDLLPESLNVVPTLVEAKDVIEMEEIERDLGF